MWQELVELINGMRRDAREHIAEPGPGIDLDAFAGRHESLQYSRCFAPVVAAEERPVIPAHCDSPQGTLRRVVVDLQIAVFAIARQRGPVLERIPHRLAGR